MASAAVFIDRYESAQSLAQVSSAPLVVCELIFAVTGGDREHLDMFRNGRKLKASDAITTRERYAVVWVARTFTHASFPQIGRAMAMDHSSIVRAYNRAKYFYLTDRDFRISTNRLLSALPIRHRVQKRAAEIIQGVGR